MRVPVVDSEGKPLMPCLPAKARHLIKLGEAKPKHSKLGIFYIQLAYVVVPNNQTLVVGVDPGSSYEGYSVVGTEDTVLNIMAEAPRHVKDAIEKRGNMRCARRHRRTWRRPCRQNRLCHKIRIPPSTRSRWEAKARIVTQLRKILPLTDVTVEDVQARATKGRGGQWNIQFSPIQVGKEHLYYLLQKLGLELHKNTGYRTKELRDTFGLSKTKDKSRQTFDSHCVDSWVMAASVSGADKPTEKRLHYIKEIRLYRRQLHVFRPTKGGKRKSYGGTRSMGLKRGTLVFHPKYELCSVGGTTATRISLNAYTDNRRLARNAKVVDCDVRTYSPYRTLFL